MKKVLTLLIAVLFTFLVSAQTEKGKVVLMGGAGVSSSTDTQEGQGDDQETKTTNYNVDFGAMYMLNEAIGVGLCFIALNEVQKVDGNKDFASALVGAKIFGRYYIPCMAPRFYTYGQLNLKYLGGSDKTYSGGDEVGKNNVSQIAIGLNPGFSYFLTPAIALEMSFGLIGWSQRTVKNSNNEQFKRTTSDLEFFAFSKTLSLGFCWWLGRKGAGF